MILRSVREDDLPVLRELRNKNREWFSDPGVVSEERHRAWYNHVKDRGEFFVIEVDGKIAGTISRTRRDTGWYEVGNLTLDDEFQGRGIMTEAVNKITNSYMNKYAVTLPHNVKSQAVFKRCGYEERGLTDDGMVILRKPADE